eukprot:8787934-Alexandrium_andersonii.AAC.1
MSASLVGSEMCIRDRAPPPWGATGRRIPVPPAPVPLTYARSDPPQPWVCLLYTSDAADDM